MCDIALRLYAWADSVGDWNTQEMEGKDQTLSAADSARLHSFQAAAPWKAVSRIYLSSVLPTWRDTFNVQAATVRSVRILQLLAA